jgi:nucleoside-diphosphate-sugar epimerase
VAKLADDSFSPVFLRNATAYGVSPRLRLDLVLNDFVAHAVLYHRIVIRSDGTPWRPVVHVDDICRAFAAVLTAPGAAVHNQAFNVGRTDENYRVSDLAEIVQQAIPDCEIEYAAGGGPDRRSYRVDCGKLQRHVPAFRPAWNVRRGIAQLRDAFQQTPLALSDLTEQRYLRLPVLQRKCKSGILNAELRTHSSAFNLARQPLTIS